MSNLAQMFVDAAFKASEEAENFKTEVEDFVQKIYDLTE